MRGDNQIENVGEKKLGIGLVKWMGEEGIGRICGICSYDMLQQT